MADNVEVTQGTGTDIATDDVSGVHFQRMKLAAGGDGLSEPIGSTDNGASHSLHVDHIAPANATVSALAASLVVKASAGTLYGIQGYSTAAGFIQVHNASSLPADTAVPAITFPVEADKPFSIDLGVRGRAFSTGIVVCISSTGPTKTIGGSTAWIDAQYV